MSIKWRLACIPLLASAAMLASATVIDPSNTLTPADPRIGKWDGKTASAVLKGAYEDRTQAEIPFGRRSFYLTPWRAYMDTWPARHLLESSGINFNVDAREAEATAQMLAEAGVRSARVEIGWGSFRYDDPTKLPDETAARLTTILSSLKKNAIRPLILLNANSGAPCPLKTVHVHTLIGAGVGERVLHINPDDAALIVPGYTGLQGMAYQTAYPLITAIDKATGKCSLSSPLTKPVQVGELSLTILKYQPFSGTVFADGSTNAAAQETLAGWKQYVQAVCTFTRDIVGDIVANDCGFDVEVWNEYTFGSQFLDMANYCSPAPKYKSELTYSAGGLSRTGPEVILPVTIDLVLNPSSGLNGVGVFSGFSNQRPWDNGAEAWPGEKGYSRHYYTNLDVTPLNKQTDPSPGNGPLSALGQPDGTPDGKDWNTVLPGSYFVPIENVSMPEKWHYGYKTEFVTRDIQPFPGPMKNHYRFTSPPGMRPLEVCMTETNTWRKPWMDAVIKAAGCASDSSRAVTLSHEIGARALLRSLVFQCHKGVHTLDVFAAKEDDLGFAFFPTAFYSALARDHYVLSDNVKRNAGRQWTVLKRLTKLLSDRERGDVPVAVPRRLGVSEVIEYKPRLVFRGDGSLKHPDRFNRDDFACLPFQVSQTKYAIAFYVVTHNMVHEWDTTRDRLDPLRYTMPDQQFDLTLTNLRGLGAVVSSYDPLTDKTTPVGVVRSTRSSITVRLITSDTPRFLIVKEAKPGVVIAQPRFRLLPNNKMQVGIASSVPCQASVSWGAVPERKSEKAESIRVNGSATVTIPLPVGKAEGVKIILNYDGLTAEWPQWDYDTLGMLPMADPRPSHKYVPGIR